VGGRSQSVIAVVLQLWNVRQPRAPLSEVAEAPAVLITPLCGLLLWNVELASRCVKLVANIATVVLIL